MNHLQAHLKLYAIRGVRKVLSSKAVYQNKVFTRFTRKRSLATATNFEQKRTKQNIFAPTSIEIELTNRCNVNCVFCPNSQMKRQRGTMSFETFKNIVDKIKQLHVPHIIISGFGEPLLDKDLIQKLKYLKQNKNSLSIMLVSNGILYTPEIIRTICEEQLVDTLSLSVDAGDVASYKEIHKVDGFNKVLKNLQFLRQIKKEKLLQTPRVDLRYKDFEFNQRQFGKFLTAFEKLCDEVSIYANICTWPGANSKIKATDPAILIRKTCPSLWDGLRINWNGDTVICPQDYEGATVFGNINEQNISDLWNSSTMISYRKKHLSFDFESLPVCKTCNINSHLVVPL